MAADANDWLRLHLRGDGSVDSLAYIVCGGQSGVDFKNIGRVVAVGEVRVRVGYSEYDGKGSQSSIVKALEEDETPKPVEFPVKKRWDPILQQYVTPRNKMP
ncbi:hypothetical protein HDU97_010197 [Phlyctochytrium planicorne]|nr:hypothetical protein HDU97_010197 [Phlyctochytrium planicorne]